LESETGTNFEGDTPLNHNDTHKIGEPLDDPGYLAPAIDQFVRDVPLTRHETASFGCAIQPVYYVLPKAL
jgi:hypothetical protein